MLRAPRLLTLVAACVTAATIQAAPLTELTEDSVRSRVQLYLTTNPDTAATLGQEVGFQFTLDPALITYRTGPGGMPDQLLVQYVVTSAPTEEQQAAAAVALARTLDAVFGQGTPALLSPADLQALRLRYKFQPVTRQEAVYWPSWTPAVASGPWVSYSPGPVYFTSYNGVPFLVGEYRFAYDALHYLYPSAFFSYWAHWPYRPYSVYASIYSPYYYWGYWGVYPPGGWGVPTGRPVYYLPPQVIREDRPAAERHFARGYTAFWDGDTAAALASFRAATEADKNDVGSWYYLALTYRARGDDRAAAGAARVGAAARVLNGG
ncbi:MAG TPA: hypothetical protein VM597_26665, partial [Gemmataceae bacterium]|nr:hypothetical protein [Gemmataceae bacterium]